MKIFLYRIKKPVFLLVLVFLSACRHPAGSFSATQLEGDWVPADTSRFSKLGNNLFTALSLYNNKGGIPDTSYYVKDDSIFVRTNFSTPVTGSVRKKHWRYWRRIYALRNDTLYLYRHGTDTMLAFAKASDLVTPGILLKKLSFLLIPSPDSRLPRFDKIEISKDTVFASTPAEGNSRVYYCSGNRLLEYMQDKIRKIRWSRTDTLYVAPPAGTDQIALIIETDRWNKSFCCYQNFRDPVFNQMMRQLDQLGGILDMKELKHPHRFAGTAALKPKQ